MGGEVQRRPLPEELSIKLRLLKFAAERGGDRCQKRDYEYEQEHEKD